MLCSSQQSQRYFLLGCKLVQMYATQVREDPLPILIPAFLTDEEADKILSRRIEDEDIPPRLLADLDVVKI